MQNFFRNIQKQQLINYVFLINEILLLCNVGVYQYYHFSNLLNVLILDILYLIICFIIHFRTKFRLSHVNYVIHIGSITQLVVIWIITQGNLIFIQITLSWILVRYKIELLQVASTQAYLVLIVILSQFQLEGFNDQRNILEMIFYFIQITALLAQYTVKIENQKPTDNEELVDSSINRSNVKQQKIIIRQYIYYQTISKWLRDQKAFILDSKLYTIYNFKTVLTPFIIKYNDHDVDHTLKQNVYFEEKLMQYKSKYKSKLDELLYSLHKQESNFFQVKDELKQNIISIIVDTYKQQPIYVIYYCPITQKDLDQEFSLDLFQSLSHELGTQLNCISTLGYLAINDEMVPTNIQNQYLIPILNNSKQLELIINNLNDYTAIMTHNFMSEIKRFNIQNEINDIVNLFLMGIQSKGIQIMQEFQTEIMNVDADRGRFRQIFYQLFSNAMRFSEKGVIKIIVRVVNAFLNVELSDEGIGMNEEEIIKLRQITNDCRMRRVSKQSIGCSLGLSISNLIASEISEGRKIEFNSARNIGSTFQFWVSITTQFQSLSATNTLIKQVSFNKYIDSQFDFMGEQDTSFVKDPKVKRLPRSSNNITIRSSSKKSHVKQSLTLNIPKDIRIISELQEQSDYIPEDEDENIILPQSHPLKLQYSILQFGLESNCCSRILIVDDEFFNIFSLEMILRKFNSKCDHAFNGQQALEMIMIKLNNPCQICHNQGYVLIFLDINMPIKDGYQTVIEIKQLQNNHQIPKAICIANSAFSDMRTKQKSFTSGMDHFFSKPLDVKLLKTLLTTLYQSD